ncbi:MAG: glycosyltransferase family 4 protein [Bacteroidaceae bacterium]|nr:glycosyltransferase family 4 protein [Bacteroidaceae bacterium]
MKIAYILNTTTSYSGDSKAFLSLLKGLVLKDIQPVIIVPNSDDIYQTFRSQGDKVYALKYKHSTYPNINDIKDVFLFVPRILGRLLLNYIATRKLISILKKENVQLVHTNVSVINIGQRAAKELSLPHIYHFREYADLVGFRHFPSKASFLSSICEKNNYAICITRGVQQYYHLNNSHSMVIYDGVRRKSENMPISTKENYFLYVGRIEPNKGLLDLLKAYNNAQTPNYPSFPKMKVAGAFSDVSYSQIINRYIEENHLENNVDLLGERKDIDQLMQHALALIVPSKFEGFGFCMAEAMFNGCIVVGYNDTGTKEQFENGLQQTGESIGFPYNNNEELIDLLTRLSSTPDIELAPIRERAFHTVNELYSIENNVQKIHNFYKQLNLLAS